jgi:hypothetical protein
MHPAEDLIAPGNWPAGYQPPAFATDTKDVVAVYLPGGGEAALELSAPGSYQATWFDPRNGALTRANPSGFISQYKVSAPTGLDEKGHPLRRRADANASNHLKIFKRKERHANSTIRRFWNWLLVLVPDTSLV